MNTLELKGSIFELIARIDNPKNLSRVHDLLENFIEQFNDIEDDWWDELTPEQQADLTTSIGETEDPQKLTSHEDVIKMSRQWLSE